MSSYFEWLPLSDPLGKEGDVPEKGFREVFSISVFLKGRNVWVLLFIAVTAFEFCFALFFFFLRASRTFEL